MRVATVILALTAAAVLVIISLIIDFGSRRVRIRTPCAKLTKL